MTDDFAPQDENLTDEHSDAPSFQPASIYKRVWAWVGVVYMVIITLLITYYIATWTFLSGITGIMLFPLLGGFSVVKGIQAMREFDYAAERVAPVTWSVISGVAALASLIWGVIQVVTLF